MTNLCVFCKNCKLHFPLVKFDYTRGGCEHTDMDGFICMAFADPHMGEPTVAIWMVGIDAERDMCECYIPKGDIAWNERPNGTRRIIAGAFIAMRIVSIK